MFKIRNPRRVLITSPHNLGDFVAKVPFIRLLKKKFPDSQILLLCRPYVMPLVKYIAEVDEVYDLENLFNRDEGSIVKIFEALKIDVCIHILSINSSIGPNIIHFAHQAGIPIRIGNMCKSSWTLFTKKNYGMTHNVRQKRILPGLHEFEWNLLPLEFFGISPSKEAVNFAELLKTKPLSKEPIPYLQPQKFSLILHPGSHGHAKEWPAQSFKQLIEQLGPEFQILLTGSAEEKKRFDFATKRHDVLDLRGELTLKELIHLISQSDGIVGASTGPVHIASLFGTKTLALFPKQKLMGAWLWGPQGSEVTVIESPVICSPCQRKLTDFNTKLCTCMEGIEVSCVQEALDKWVNHENFV